MPSALKALTRDELKKLGHTPAYIETIMAARKAGREQRAEARRNRPKKPKRSIEELRNLKFQRRYDPEGYDAAMNESIDIRRYAGELAQDAKYYNPARPYLEVGRAAMMSKPQGARKLYREHYDPESRQIFLSPVGDRRTGEQRRGSVSRPQSGRLRRTPAQERTARLLRDAGEQWKREGSPGRGVKGAYQAYVKEYIASMK
jgi:hypothetical protein